jgi:hypothetical protein
MCHRIALVMLARQAREVDAASLRIRLAGWPDTKPDTKLVKTL